MHKFPLVWENYILILKYLLCNWDFAQRNMFSFFYFSTFKRLFRSSLKDIRTFSQKNISIDFIWSVELRPTNLQKSNLKMHTVRYVRQLIELGVVWNVRICCLSNENCLKKHQPTTAIHKHSKCFLAYEYVKMNRFEMKPSSISLNKSKEKKAS